MIQKELDEIGAESVGVMSAIAARNQELMLDEDEASAGLVQRQEDEQTSGETALQFKLPFSTDGYKGSMGLRATFGGKTHAGVFYYKIDKRYIYIKAVSSYGFIGVGLNGNRPSMR